LKGEKDMNNKVYEIVTDQILSSLERGVIPWRKPWNCKTEYPRNLVSGKGYQGINVWILISMCYSSPYWLTFNQIKKLGGKVRKNEKGTIVVYWNFKDVEETDTDTGESNIKKVPFLRYYRVFNANQCEGLMQTEDIPEGPIYPIDEAEKIISGYIDKPEIKHGFTKASYNMSADLIKMPFRAAFSSIEEYYSTLFHECVHSSGHPSRLNRDTMVENAGFGSKIYAREELLAEMGSAFLCGITGIATATVENSAAYIESWREKITKDPRLVVIAAAHAQKAAEYILGQHYDGDCAE